MAAPTIVFDGILLGNADGGVWTGGAVDTDSKIQGTGCIGNKVSNGLNDFFEDGSSKNVSTAGYHLFGWVNCLTPNLDTKANGGLRLILGNATNYASWYVGGNGSAANDPYSGGWKCFVVDHIALAANAGTKPTMSAVTRWGGAVKTVSMISGNFNNGLVDAQRAGLGLRLTAGDATTPGTFQRLRDEDYLTANKYGVIRKAGGVYFVQGKILLGNGSTTSLFQDSGQVVVFEYQRVATTFYEIRVTANATMTLGTYSGGSTSNGVTILGADNPDTAGKMRWHLNNTGGVITLNACTIGQARLVTLGASDTVRDTTFTGCGTVSPNGAAVTNALVTAGTDTAALSVSSPTQMAAITNSKFTNNNRAIEITASGTYTFDGIEFSGNTIDVRNSSTGLVTVNVVNGGDSPSFENTNGGTTVVNNSVTFTLNGLKDGSEVLILRDSDSVVLFNDENITGGTSSYAYNAGADTPVTVFIHHVNYVPVQLAATLGGTNQTVPIQQRTDRIYKNPP